MLVQKLIVRTIFMVAVLVMIAVPSVVRATGLDDFGRGQAAFKRGDYRAAARYYEKARTAGLAKIAVYYNLGVVYYKLGRYGKSRRNFEIVSRDRGMADIGYYNLGLIAVRVGNADKAQQYFTMTLEISRNAKLRLLAKRALRALAGDARSGFFVAAYGYDSNVTAATTGAAAGPDNFLLLRGVGRIPLGESQARGWSLAGKFTLLDFSTLDGYDYLSLGAELRKLTRLGRQPAFYRFRMETSNLGSSSYLSILGAEFGVREQLRNQGWRGYVRVDSISAAPAYYYQAGYRARLRVERRHYQKTKKWRGYYELEMNERTDMVADSYSPTRHSLVASARYKIGRQWQAGAILSYRLSDYPVVAGTKRDDQRLRLLLQLDRKTGQSTRLRLRYRYTGNASSVGIYNYAGHRFYIGVGITH